MNCCVVGCTNRYTSCPTGTTFYSFSTRPCFVGQRQQWIRAVRRKNADGTDWEPTRHSRICSVHFVGGASSKDVSSPSYAPTIFPEEYRKRSVLPEDKSGRYERYKKRRTATAALPQTSTSLPDLLQAAPPTVVTEAPVDLPASPAFAPEFEEPEVTGEHNEARHQEGVEVPTQTSWTSEPQDQGVLMISCVLNDRGISSDPLPPLPSCESSYKPDPRAVSMEPIQSSSHGDEAALLGKTSCPVKATEDIWFGCCSCTYFTRDQRGIVSHLVAHDDDQVKCHHPSIFPRSKFKVHSNAQKHKSDKLFKCNLCPQTFAQNSQLRTHNLTHSGEKPYKCKLCSKTFAHGSTLINHKRTHSGEKPYKCKLCSKTFAHRSTLINHERTHSGEKPYKCNLCPQAFAYSGSLIYHKNTHTGEKPFKCKLCPQEFASRNSLMYHKQTHTGVKPFKCELCPREFTQSSALKSHIRIHSGEKPYKCNLCPQAFAQHSQLRNHNVTHSGEKPYKCELCSKAFAYRGGLNYHKKTHTGEKSFKCHLCPKAFSESYNLKKHIRKMHTDEKPYKCKLCSQAFARKSHLDSHNQTHNAKRPFKPLLLRPLFPKPSQACSQAFAKDSSLIYHNQTHT